MVYDVLTYTFVLACCAVIGFLVYLMVKSFNEKPRQATKTVSGSEGLVGSNMASDGASASCDGAGGGCD